MTGAALILGASGQDGTLIARRLADDGVRVHGAGRQLGHAAPAAWAHYGLTDAVARHSLDPCDTDAVRALIDHVRPATIFCMTGQSSVGQSFAAPGETMRSHILPVIAIGEAVHALRIDPHVILAGSGEVFGETTAAAPATEASSFAPASPYASAKVAAIELAHAFRAHAGVRFSVAHLFGHESPIRGDRFVFGKVMGAIAAIRAGRIDALRLGRGDVIRDWGWAPDYADAMVGMARRDTPCDLILATGVSVTLEHAVTALFDAAGLDAAAHVTFGDAHHARPSEARTMHADPSLAREILGWTGSVPFPALAERLLATPGLLPGEAG